MCEHCPEAGGCIVCGRTGDPRRDLAAMTRAAERAVAEARRALADAEHRLMKLKRLSDLTPSNP